MPEAYPDEFRNDVVALARKREIPWTQIAKDFGISKAAVHNWVKRHHADVADLLAAAAPVSGDSGELREARKRIRLLEQEAEVMRRAVVYPSRGVNPE